MNNCKITWGGRELDVVVHEIEVETENEYLSAFGGQELLIPHSQTFTLTGRLNKIGLNEMMHDGMNNGRGLLQKLQDQSLSEEMQVLRKHHLVDEAGVVTSTGIQVLAQTLLESNKTEIVNKLKKLDDED